MTWQEFLDTRSPEYLCFLAAIQKGEAIPSFLLSTRVKDIASRPSLDTWANVVDVIVFVVRHRRDKNNSCCIHTSPVGNWRQYNNIIREYYVTHIQGLDL